MVRSFLDRDLNVVFGPRFIQRWQPSDVCKIGSPECQQNGKTANSYALTVTS